MIWSCTPEEERCDQCHCPSYGELEVAEDVDAEAGKAGWMTKIKNAEISKRPRIELCIKRTTTNNKFNKAVSGCLSL